MMRPMNRYAAPLVFVFSAGSLFGCADNPPPKTAEVAKPTPMASPPPPSMPSKPPDSPTASAVRISDEIAKACGISEPDAFFAFDSANVRQTDADVLGKIVTCFMTGPLKGRTLKLVGHADPRGGSDYNLTLGQSRSDSVAQYLIGKGLEKAKTQASSRGAMDATGSDDPSWARDRRVDMMLGQ